MPEENRPAAEALAAQSAGMTAEIDRLIRLKEQRARERDQVWAEASELGMAHTVIADLCGVHHCQVDKGVQRARDAGVGTHRGKALATA